jgi:hypothetical protein
MYTSRNQNILRLRVLFLLCHLYNFCLLTYIVGNSCVDLLTKLAMCHTIPEFEENRRIRPMDERNNESFTKDCVKILPNHGCFRDNHLEKFETINQKLLKKITDDMQPEKIIVPIFNSENDTLIKRWRIWLDYHHKNSGEYSAFWDWNEWSDYLVQDNPYGNNVHYVDIEKLTSGDNDEYLKLCEAIDETPIDNIQEDITAYRNILSEVAEQYDRINK